MRRAGKASEVQVKICGLTNLDDAKAALDFGADFLGFVVYEKSPRFISGTQLRRICEKLPGIVRSVGVFVNMPRVRAMKMADECGLFAVQLHGQESPREYMNMPRPVWRAVFFRGKSPVPRPETWDAERYLIDVKKEGRCGRTDITTDWDKAAEFSLKWQTMLAGGLNADNITTAIRKVRPLGVDVSSGIEKESGIKDLRKMELFIKLAKFSPQD